MIREVGGDVVKEYLGFEQVQGDIFLDKYQDGVRHGLSKLTQEDGQRHPFRYLVDIERKLYPTRRLGVDASGCKARLHFRDGQLYTTGKLFRVDFADANGSGQHAAKRLRAAVSCGLDISVPTGARVVLHFSKSDEDFEFNPKKNYRVSVTHRAASVDRDHFKYYYGIMRRPPAAKLIPDRFFSTDSAELGDPFCLNGAFGSAEYQLATSHLDW